MFTWFNIISFLSPPWSQYIYIYIFLDYLLGPFLSTLPLTLWSNYNKVILVHGKHHISSWLVGSSQAALSPCSFLLTLLPSLATFPTCPIPNIFPQLCLIHFILQVSNSSQYWVIYFFLLIKTT